MIYEYIPNSRHTDNARIFIEPLLFIHYPTGANAFIWNDKDNAKKLFYIDKYIAKKLVPIN